MPSAFGDALRAPVVAAAIGRGLERAGITPPPDLCPVAGGGRGTIEVLLPVLGGETGDGFALIEDGGTALVELGASGRETGSRVVRALSAGVEVVVVVAGGLDDGSAKTGGEADGIRDGAAPDRAIRDLDGTVEAIEDGGGLRGAALVLLCDTRAAWPADADVADLRRDPRGVPMTAAGGGLAGALWARYDAHLVAGAPFVLEQLDFDARMRAARAVVIGDARLDRRTLDGRIAGEVAIRARQAGVPCHAIVADDAIDPFDARVLDLQAIVEARTIAQLEAAGERIAQFL